MQLVWSEMRVSFRHRQTLVAQQLSNILQLRARLPQHAGEMVSQVMPMKVRDLSLLQRLVEPVPPVLKRVAGLDRLKDPACRATLVNGSQGSQSCRVQRNVKR